MPGCVQNEQTKKSLCGPLLMDTGAPGRGRAGSGAGPVWAPSTSALLILAENGKPVAAARFITDRRDHASKLSFRSPPNGRPQAIYAGLLPYFVWSVLYDPAAGTVAVKARTPVGEGPSAVPLS